MGCWCSARTLAESLGRQDRHRAESFLGQLFTWCAFGITVRFSTVRSTLLVSFSRSFVLRPLLAELSEVLVFSKDSCESLGRQDRHRAGFLGRLPGALRLLVPALARRYLAL